MPHSASPDRRPRDASRARREIALSADRGRIGLGLQLAKVATDGFREFRALSGRTSGVRRHFSGSGGAFVLVGELQGVAGVEML
jgi:hypothetical protein